MFVATFRRVSPNSKIRPDKHGRLSYIGEVFAGTCNGKLINGTIFENDNRKEETYYVCKNEFRNYEGRTQVDCVIIKELEEKNLEMAVKLWGPPKEEFFKSSNTKSETTSGESDVVTKTTSKKASKVKETSDVQPEVHDDDVPF